MSPPSVALVSETIIAVFGASAARPGEGPYEAGVRCGRLLAAAGFGVVTGGYGGLMEAVSKGAGEAGGRVIGVTVPTVFSDRSGANRFVTEEVRAATLVERIHELTDVSSGSIVLPGSIGTLTELAVAWNLAYVSRHTGQPPKPVVTVGAQWRNLVETLAAALATDPDLVVCTDDVDAAVVEIGSRVPA
jgi:uncharacterized protein (TIGR00730 family)